jgi:hypothetical protein
MIILELPHYGVICSIIAVGYIIFQIWMIVALSVYSIVDMFIFTLLELYVALNALLAQFGYYFAIKVLLTPMVLLTLIGVYLSLEFFGSTYQNRKTSKIFIYDIS